MPVTVIPAAEIHPQEFDAGETRFKIVDLIARDQGAPVTGGMFEIWNSVPVEFEYDGDCGLGIVMEGVATTEPNDGELQELHAGDVFYIPQQAGLVVAWHSPDYARVFFVTFPHWR